MSHFVAPSDKVLGRCQGYRMNEFLGSRQAILVYFRKVHWLNSRCSKGFLLRIVRILGLGTSNMSLVQFPSALMR